MDRLEKELEKGMWTTIFQNRWSQMESWKERSSLSLACGPPVASALVK